MYAFRSSRQFWVLSFELLPVIGMFWVGDGKKLGLTKFKHSRMVFEPLRLFYYKNARYAATIVNGF